MVPSSVVSTSARSTEPTPEPSGTSEASTVPRGCLAPAARQVQVESAGLAGEFDFDAMGHTGRQATAVTARHAKQIPSGGAKKGLRTP